VHVTKAKISTDSSGYFTRKYIIERKRHIALTILKISQYFDEAFFMDFIIERSLKSVSSFGILILLRIFHSSMLFGVQWETVQVRLKHYSVRNSSKFCLQFPL